MVRAAARSIAETPRGLLERSNPVDEQDEALEYEVYGWWRFDTDAEGVRRLGRQWVSMEQLVGMVGGDWQEKVAAFEARVAALTRQFT